MVESFADLHVLGVTIDGSVWHTRRSPTGWTPFALVPTPAGQRAIDVACVRRVPVPPETTPNTQGLWVLIAYESSPPQLWSRADTGQWL
jgi:hypothetical protein